MSKKANFKDIKIVCASVPQQDNAFDCALFLLSYAEKLFSDISLFTLADSFACLQQWFPVEEVF